MDQLKTLKGITDLQRGVQFFKALLSHLSRDFWEGLGPCFSPLQFFLGKMDQNFT